MYMSNSGNCVTNVIIQNVFMILEKCAKFYGSITEILAILTFQLINFISSSFNAFSL